IEGDRATVDWTESDDAPVGPAGLTLPALSSATFDGTLHCFPHLVPLNHGIVRALDIRTRPGSATHVLHPTPVAGYCASGYEKCGVAGESSGDGRYRGGYGWHRRWRMLGDAVNSIHGDREEVTPPGVAGGTNGGPNRLVLNMGTPEERSLGMFATNVPLRKSDVLDFVSNGGGGYGNPLEREPEPILQEVIDGFMTVEKARRTYGVAIEVVD